MKFSAKNEKMKDKLKQSIAQRGIFCDLLQNISDNSMNELY